MRPTQERKIYIIIFSACELASQRARGPFHAFLFSYARNSSARQTPSLTGKHNKHFKTKTHAAVAQRFYFYLSVCVEPRDHPVSETGNLLFLVLRIHRSIFSRQKYTGHMSLFLFVVQEVETFARRREIMRNLCLCAEVSW